MQVCTMKPIHFNSLHRARTFFCFVENICTEQTDLLFHVNNRIKMKKSAVNFELTNNAIKYILVV